jgi:rRNA small subunit pseudouridine methyltransferase Nep1
VHTIDDKVILVGQNVRLPKSYHRFVGLIEKLYSEKEVGDNNKKLLELKNMTFSDLIKKIDPKQVIALSSEGIKSNYQQLSKEINDKTCLVVGGFQKGEFSDKIKKCFDKVVSVDANPLEAHIIISRVLYEYEKRIIM